MPSNTPLTSTPKPILTDPANVETTIAPGFDTLEKFVVPRFSSLSQRNAAFSGQPIATQQLCSVTGEGAKGFYVWNGSAWEELGLYTGLRPLINISSVNAAWSSTGTYKTADTPNISVQAGATYTFRALLAVETTSTARAKFSLYGPSGSSAAAGLFGYDGGTGMRDYDELQSNYDSIELGNIGNNPYVTMAVMHGHLVVGGTAGTFGLRYARVDGSGSVRLNAGSYIQAFKKV